MDVNTKTRIYKVSELTHSVKSILDSQLPKVWIEGEISNLTFPSSGHTYFTLKDENSQIKAVLFKFKNNAISSPTPLKNGLCIYVFGKVTVYERGGNYQIIVDNWEPKGIGALQLAFEELKKKLHKEGLFDTKYKKSIPMLPKTIGIITSPTGAAVRDIINVLTRRFPNIEILLYPVRVQGKGSAEEVADAIKTMNTMPEIDVLIIGRGGGSLEDLWAFNEECVARSIFSSEIPIISAVGHEIDYTISDFVADMRAATPSEAAEKVIARKLDFTEKIKFLTHKLNTALDIYIKNLRKKLDLAASSYVFKEPENTLTQYNQRLDELTHRLNQKIKHVQDINSHKINALIARVKSLNPESILKRGYSITKLQKTNEIIKNPKELKKGDSLVTKVAEGEFISTLTTKKTKK